MKNTSKVKEKSQHKFKKILLIILFIGCFFCLCILSYVGILSATLHLNHEQLQSINTPLQVFNTNNEKLIEASTDTTFISLTDLPTSCIDAFISIEDNAFYEHNGININRIIKSIITNISSGKIVEGASTITQQLIKNTHLSSDKTYERKIKEIVLALKMEQEYTKDQILEMYLNAIYFGNGCYGIESASQFYFGKSASDLTINQSAVLASIIKSPTYYSPINYPEDCTARKNIVLAQMLKYDKITSQQYEENSELGLELSIQKQYQCDNDLAYLFSATEEASKILSMSPSSIAVKGYKIYTYMDSEKQDNLTQSFTDAGADNYLKNGIIINNSTGGIEAFDSSFKYGGNSLKRSPASCIKPVLVYAPALEYKQIYACSLLDDCKREFDNGYSPSNIGDKYYGLISATDSLAYSLNVPAVQLLSDIGIEKCKSFAKNCGIEFDKNDNGLAIALGGLNYGISIQNLCNSYSTFANNGNYLSSTFIRKIEDQSGNVLYEHNPISINKMSQDTAYLVGQMMRATTQKGTCTALSGLPYEVHAKSGTNGTTNKSLNTDAICIAQTSEHTACVWYFSKDNTEENLLPNASVSQVSPTQNIKHLFKKIYKNDTPKDFEKPDSIITLDIDSQSYLDGNVELASPSTPAIYTRQEIFSKNNQPQLVSKTFSNIKNTNLTSIQNGEDITLTFDTIPYQRYELIKVTKKSQNTQKTVTLLTVDSTDEETTYTDTLSKNDEIQYYVRVSNVVANTAVLSNKISINSNNEISTDNNSNSNEELRKWWY